MIGIDDRPGPARQHTGDRLYVAVVDGDQAVRHGLVRLLEHDPRLHLMDPVARVAELQTASLQYDVCVLGLPETGITDEVAELMRHVPCVVWTSALDWKPWVAAWVWGARGAVGHDVARVPFADAVWDAVHSPYNVQPQLARALLDGITASGLHAPSVLADVLGRVAEGQRVLATLSASGISPAAYVSDMIALRGACERAGLGVLQIAGSSWRDGGQGHVFEPGAIPPEALMLSSRIREVLRYYADGYGYDEIAQLLNIGETTVKSHVLTAMDKFGITSNRSSEVRLLFAIYVSGRHRHPDLVRRRLDSIRDDALGGLEAPSAALPL